MSGSFAEYSPPLRGLSWCRHVQVGVPASVGAVSAPWPQSLPDLRRAPGSVRSLCLLPFSGTKAGAEVFFSAGSPARSKGSVGREETGCREATRVPLRGPGLHTLRSLCTAGTVGTLRWETWLSSRPPAAACCRHLGSEPDDGRVSLSLALALSLCSRGSSRRCPARRWLGVALPQCTC